MTEQAKMEPKLQLVFGNHYFNVSGQHQLSSTDIAITDADDIVIADDSQVFTLTDLGGMAWAHDGTALSVNDTFTLKDVKDGLITYGFNASGTFTAQLTVSDGVHASAVADFKVFARKEAALPDGQTVDDSNTVDYSSSTENLMIVTGAGWDTIQSGMGSDYIYAGTGNDYITLADDDLQDEIVYYFGKSSVSDGYRAADSGNKVRGFERGIDVLTLKVAADSGVTSTTLEEFLESNTGADGIKGNADDPFHVKFNFASDGNGGVAITGLVFAFTGGGTDASGRLGNAYFDIYFDNPMPLTTFLERVGKTDEVHAGAHEINNNINPGFGSIIDLKKLDEIFGEDGLRFIPDAAPVLTQTGTASSSLLEGGYDTETEIGLIYTATDADDDLNSVTISVSDSRFDITPDGKLVIKANTNFDHDAGDDSIDLIITASDGTYTDTETVTLAFGSVVSPPVFASSDQLQNSPSVRASLANGNVNFIAKDPGQAGNFYKVNIFGLPSNSSNVSDEIFADINNNDGRILFFYYEGRSTIGDLKKKIADDYQLETAIMLEALPGFSDSDLLNAPNSNEQSLSGGMDAQFWTLSSNAAAGAEIGTAFASDANGDTITYSIVSGNDDGYFAIDPITGVVQLAAGADIRFVTGDFTIGVMASSMGVGEDKLTVEREFFIKIDDVNSASALSIEAKNPAQSDIDVIISEGLEATIAAGYGDDRIMLGDTENNPLSDAHNDDAAQTIYYRFDSGKDPITALQHSKAVDGGDVIYNYDASKDKLVFVDVNASAISSFDAFLDAVKSVYAVWFDDGQLIDKTKYYGLEFQFHLPGTMDDAPPADDNRAGDTLTIIFDGKRDDGITVNASESAESHFEKNDTSVLKKNAEINGTNLIEALLFADTNVSVINADMLPPDLTFL